MRKALTLLLAALVILSAGFGIAQGAVNSRKEAVTWEEETLYGDKSQVSGAVVTATNHLTSNLQWKTEGILGEELNPTTEFTFSNDSIRYPYEITYEGLYMYAEEDFLASISFNGTDRIPEYAREKYADLIAYCKACFDSVDVGEEKEFTLNLADYMDYYSLGGHFDFPDCSWSLWNEFEGRFSYGVPESYIEDINDFFRIPILGDYSVEYTINRVQNGDSFGTSFGGGAVTPDYRPEFDAVYINGTCYLTFNTVAGSGEVADTSLIPGGYGIYRLNTSRDEEGNLVLGDPVAEMVYPMDPSVGFYYLDASDDGRHIYLHTWQGTKLMRSIIDVQTMECLQTLCLTDQPEHFYRDMKQYDDFLVVLQLSYENFDSDRNSITVFEEDAQGLYHHCFTVPMNIPELDVHMELEIFTHRTDSMDFDGKTLLVVQNESESDRYAYSYGDNCNFHVLAYNAQGLAYAGKYYVNLANFRSGQGSENWLVKPFFDDPIRIQWN